MRAFARRHGLAPLAWSEEGDWIPTLHGVAYRDLMRRRVVTAWLGLHWLIGSARWVWWEMKRPMPAHKREVDFAMRYLQYRAGDREIERRRLELEARRWSLYHDAAYRAVLSVPEGDGECPR